MAQIIPPITSLPIDSSAAPSVEDIQDRLPSICVDYLSHDWSEEDVWASWRNMTRHKHEIANGVRLENASWRTWQKQRNKLKTISPETLNWLKDSDVTWLYGPLHTANVEPVRPLKVASTDERYGIDRPNPNLPAPVLKKPILKHRTLSEMLTGPRPSSPILEATTSRDEMDSDDKDLDRPQLLQSKSDTNVMRARTQPVTREKSPPRDFNLDIGTATAIASNTDHLNQATSPGSVTSPGSNAEGGKKHISFNTFVEQVIALDEPRDLNNNLDSSDDEMLEMRSSSYSSSSRSSRPSLSRTSSSNSDHLTIAKIAPTSLKTLNLPGSSGAMIYAPPPEYQSPGNNSQASFDFPSPQVDKHTGKWANHDEDEDDYGSVGFDYFGGPNLGGTSGSGGEEGDRRSAAQPIPSHVASSSHGKNSAPTVNQPPQQPKWRQQPQGQGQSPSASAEPSSVSSSSSSSSSLNVLSPPQPSRSILKVRSPQQSTSNIPEPSSPPTAYFNYTPSAATGIGGMRGSAAAGSPYDYSTPGPTGSPISSPQAAINTVDEQRGRGRTPSRDRGLNDRSTSRGTSTSSTGSFGSASSARSPNEQTATSPSGSQQVLPRKVSSPSSQLDKVQEGVSWQPSSSTEEKEKDAANYVPDRSNTPTPHSSPQISLRPLKDTSPASLPHQSTTTRVSDLPKADPPTTISPTNSTSFAPTSSQSTAHAPAPSSSSSTSASATAPPSNARSNSGGKATIAHVGTNAQPTLSNQPFQLHDEDDGASIMGRAANIASTAKDLLGALWYGNEGGTAGGNVNRHTGTQGQGQGQGGHGAGAGGRGHRRGTSLG